MGITPKLRSIVGTDAAASLEQELSGLAKRREAIAEGVERATRGAAEARSRLREILLNEADARVLDEAEISCRTANERRETLEDGLRALDERISSAQCELRNLRARSERERVATALISEADQIDLAAEKVGEAARTLASAFEQLRSAISPGSRLQTPGRESLGPDRIAGLIVAEALAQSALPLFSKEPSEFGVISVLRRAVPIGDGVVRFEVPEVHQFAGFPSASAAAQAFLSARLRAQGTHPVKAAELVVDSAGSV